MILEVVTDPEKIPHRFPEGLRVYTIGRAFDGLSVGKFRDLLRKAGMIVETRFKPTQDLVIVGEDPSLGAEIIVLPFSGGLGKPVVVAHRAFVDKYYDVLRHVEIRRGVTFEEHLEEMRAARTPC